MLFRALILLCGTLAPAFAQPYAAPPLAGASSFGQTWDPQMLDAAQAFGITDLRDEVFWHYVEEDGRYLFDSFLTQYPALLPPRGMELSVILNGGHPEFDDGATPYTGEGVAAFARYAGEVVRRYPAVTSIEMGNEMNSATFVSGPMDEAPLDQRAAYYTALLKATYETVKAERPGVRVLGAAAHSIPLAWFSALSDAGAPEWMDTLVIHPYTTRPEQLGRQIALLRQIPGFETMPIEATEFGDPNPDTAAATLLKYYCQMAVSGVARAVWYPLNTRGDGFPPLIGTDYGLTDVGRLFAFLSDRAVGQPATDVAPDRMTYACQLGPRLLVIWGEPREMTLAPGVEVLGPDLAPAAPVLSRDVPLILVSESGPVALGDTVDLAPQEVLADSFHDYAYPGRPPGGFTALARVAGREVAFDLMPGQHTNGVPWTPYLGLEQDGMVRLAPDWLMPSMSGDGPIDIVHRYVAPRDLSTELVVLALPGTESVDGIEIVVTVNGDVVTQDRVEAAFGFTLPDLALQAGDVLDISVGPGGTAEGDVAGFRVTLRAPLAVPQ